MPALFASCCQTEQTNSEQQKGVIELWYSEEAASEDPDPGKMWQAEREAPVALQL